MMKDHLMLCISPVQVQHRFGNRHIDQQSPNQPGPLASAGGHSQQTQRHAQCGQRAAHWGRESTWYRRPQPRHPPVHWRSNRGNEAGVRLYISSVTQLEQWEHSGHKGNETKIPSTADSIQILSLWSELHVFGSIQTDISLNGDSLDAMSNFDNTF